MGAGTIGMLTGAATGVGGAIVNEALAGRQQNRNKELMGIQHKNQQELNKQGREGQLQMWKDTNYPAQLAMMKDAGLSAGMMYGQSGAGGQTTTGSQGGGTATGGGTPQGTSLDIGNALQAGLMKAQTDKIKAETNNLRAQEDKSHQEGKSIWLNNILKKIGMWDEGGLRIYRNERYGQAGFNPDDKEGRMLEVEPSKLEQELKNLKIEKEAKQAGIKLTEEQTRKIYHDILQGWAKTGIQALNAIEIGKIIKTSIGKEGK